MSKRGHIWLLLFFSLFSYQGRSQTFPCDNSFYLTQTSKSSPNSSLIRMSKDTLTGVWEQEQISPDLGYRVSTLGYRVQDNLLYGITQPDLKLIQINGLGEVKELANLIERGLDTSRWDFFCGDVAPGGHIFYLIGQEKETGTAVLACTIRLRPNYRVGSISFNSIEAMHIDDLAYDPIYGIINTYDRNSNTLTAVSQSGSATNYFSQINPDIGAVAGLVFDKEGVLWGIARGSAENRTNNRLIRFNKFNGEIQERVEIPPGEEVSACSCPYSLDYFKSISPDTTSGCERLVLSYSIINKTGTGQANVVLRDTLPKGLQVDSILKQPFLTTYSFDELSGALELEFRELVIGVDSLILEVSAKSTDVVNWNTRASIGPLPKGVGETIFSDNPFSEADGDATKLTFVPLSLSFSSEAFLCSGEALMLTPRVSPTQASLAYSWDTGDSTSSISVKEPGLYTLKISNNCQTLSDSVQVGGSTFPFSVDLGPDYKLAEGKQERIFYSSDIPNAYELFWEVDSLLKLDCNTCEQPLLTALGPGKVVLTLTDVFGCSATDTLFIDVEKIRDVWMPNVFTPNGDGINEILYLQGTALANFRNFRVVDRWGQQVFFREEGTINQKNEGWDGVRRGNSLDGGVYYWSIEVLYPDQSVEIMQGVVTLLQ
ncbi:MAG: gliding motility-associated C-terminal domain-containing protein [Bacteroidota bacterium]